MNGKDWNKNDTSYYGVYHTADDGDWWGWIDNLVTNNFGEWLKRKNKSHKKFGKRFSSRFVTAPPRDIKNL